MRGVLWWNLNPMRYLIILIIFIFSFGIASAQEESKTIANWANLIYQKIDRSAKQALDFVKQNTNTIPRGAEDKAKEILEDTQKTVAQKTEQAKEEIKQEIKEQTKSGIKKIFQGIVKSAKKKVLSPLKDKIQEGSGLIRKFVNQLKDYLIDWSKE